MKTFLAALSVFLAIPFALSRPPTAQDLKNDFTLSMSDAARRYSDCIDQAMLNGKIANAYADTLFRLRDSIKAIKAKK